MPLEAYPMLLTACQHFGQHAKCWSMGMCEFKIIQDANAACCMTSMLLAANAVSFLPHNQVYFDETTKIFTDTILPPKASN